MKFTFVYIILASLVSMCGHDTDLESQHTEVVQEEAQVLSLNGTERWQADEPTNWHVQQLQALVKEYEQQAENKTAEAYNDLGQAMQAELQLMFKDCTMKGAAHDMLHTYLEPLMADVKLLAEKDEASAEAALGRISTHLQAYTTYFK
ncbi:hypothetical protein [Pontibacter roseus]|uniref:hypothetical protein n=1 Tax=Pontibacter roseus TaxID=336989 RepID=UPI000365BC7C|nr:hypothetical protein [Pontibacter roseus]